MWVVNILEKFEVKTSPKNVIRFPFPITIDKGKTVGFLPVYETLEDAKADYPNADYTEIRKKND